MRIKLPDNVIDHSYEDDDNTTAYCIPADGFEKLIGFENQKITWVHKDYRVEPKRGKKHGKTNS